MEIIVSLSLLTNSEGTFSLSTNNCFFFKIIRAPFNQIYKIHSIIPCCITFNWRFVWPFYH